MADRVSKRTPLTLPLLSRDRLASVMPTWAARSRDFTLRRAGDQYQLLRSPDQQILASSANANEVLAAVARGEPNPAWREQCWGLVALSISAVVLNWATTGDHLFKTIFTDTYWPVAGVDLSLLVCAFIGGWAALKLARRERGIPALTSKGEKQTESKAGEVAHA